MKLSIPIIQRARAGSGLIAALTAFLILMALQSAGGLRRLEQISQDMLRVGMAEPMQSPVAMVYLDDVSLKQAEEEFGVPFPWPRETYGAALDYFNAAGAKIVVFDFLFTSQSPMGFEDDLVFADAAKRYGPAIGGMQLLSAEQPEAVARFMKQKKLHTLEIKNTGLDQAHGVDAPKEPLWSAFSRVGDVRFEQDQDGLGRRVRLAVELNGRVYPSLSLAAAHEFMGRPAMSVRDGRLWLGEKSVPVDSSLRMTLRFPQRPEGKSWRLLDVVKSGLALAEGAPPLIDPSHFKDKAVFIGSSAPGLKDLRPTPLNESMPGVEMQAMAFDNLVQGRAAFQPGMNPLAWFLVLGICLLVGMGSFRFRGVAVALPFLTVVAGCLALGVGAYVWRDRLLPLAAPLLGSALAFTGTVVEHYLHERAQRRRVQGVFGQFLSPAVLARLTSRGGALVTGGETRDLSLFFSDLQGFTSFSEKLDPQVLVQILNTYLEDMAEVVVGENDGYVDKFIGDAIMAFWNAPTDRADHAAAACRSAWECQRRLAEIQDELKEMGLEAGDEGMVMRIGLNTGPAVVGLMGSHRKVNYTAMGDSVNLAARLEGANKAYGTRVLLSEATKKAAGGSAICRSMDLLRVKGKTEPVAVFELVGVPGLGDPLYDDDYLAVWEKAMQDFRNSNFAEARKSFDSLLKREPKDKPARLYVDRCDQYLETPPPPGWDGVTVMKTK